MVPVYQASPPLQALLPVDVLVKIRRAIGLAGAFEETNGLGFRNKIPRQAISEVQFVVRQGYLHDILAPLFIQDPVKVAQLIEKMIRTLGLPLATCFKLSYAFQPHAVVGGDGILADPLDLQVLLHKAM